MTDKTLLSLDSILVILLLVVVILGGILLMLNLPKWIMGDKEVNKTYNKTKEILKILPTNLNNISNTTHISGGEVIKVNMTQGNTTETYIVLKTNSSVPAQRYVPRRTPHNITPIGDKI